MLKECTQMKKDKKTGRQTQALEKASAGNGPMNKNPRSGHWRPEAALGIPVRSGAEVCDCIFSYLLPLGSSITSETRKPWGSLWGGRKSLSSEVDPSSPAIPSLALASPGDPPTHIVSHLPQDLGAQPGL